MKIAGHTIQFGQQVDKTTLECTCGRVLAMVNSGDREATSAVFKLGRCNIDRHFENPNRQLETVTEVAA